MLISPQKTKLHIGLLLDSRETYMRAIRRGVCQYALPGRPWIMCGVMPGTQAASVLLNWGVDGVIASIYTEEMAGWLEGLNRPVVNVSGRCQAEKIPRITNDDAAVGRLAADHFLAQRFTRFAFLGSPTDIYAERRFQAYCQRLGEAGHQIASFRGKSLDPVDDLPLATWLGSLARGTAIFASDDRWALRASEVAREADLSIPEHFALLGVGDDEMCVMTHPPLSSIRTPGEQIGFEAAHLLDQLMAGKRAPAQPMLLPPFDVHERQSTRPSPIDDPDIAAAVRYISEHACEQISVEAVSSSVAMSRRNLELGFQRFLGRSPLNEIRRVRIDQAKRLLAVTDLKVAQIANACGFSSAQRLAVVFGELVHETPTDYRERLKRTDPRKE